MSEFPELSRLPKDPSYWNRLESKLATELSQAVRALAGARPEWWAPLARRAWALGGLAAAAGIAALLLVPPRTPATTPPTGPLKLPADPVLVALLAPRPPALASFLIPLAGSRR